MSITCDSKLLVITLYRLLTFCYLAAFNWWLLVCPSTLSHDWQMGSIPLVTSLADCRNLTTALFLTCCVLIAYRCAADFEVKQLDWCLPEITFFMKKYTIVHLECLLSLRCQWNNLCWWIHSNIRPSSEDWTFQNFSSATFKTFLESLNVFIILIYNMLIDYLHIIL